MTAAKNQVINAHLKENFETKRENQLGTFEKQGALTCHFSLIMDVQTDTCIRGNSSGPELNRVPGCSWIE